jgi:hypothetical protein
MRKQPHAMATSNKHKLNRARCRGPAARTRRPRRPDFFDVDRHHDHLPFYGDDGACGKYMGGPPAT